MNRWSVSRIASCVALLVAGDVQVHAQSGELVAASGVTTSLGPNLPSGSAFQWFSGGTAVPESGGLGLLVAQLDSGSPAGGHFRVGGDSGPTAFAGYGFGSPLHLGPADAMYGGYFQSVHGSIGSAISIGGTSVAFQATSATGASGLWLNGALGNVASALADTPPPIGPIDPPCVTYRPGGLFPLRSTANGVAVALGGCSTQGGGTISGAWTLSGGEWRLRILLGSDGAFGPGLGSGTVFGGSSNLQDIAIAQDGALYFVAETNTGFRGIWRSTASGNEPIALSTVTDQLGPALGPSTSFASFRREIALSRDGLRVGFIAEIQGVGVVSGNNLGVFIHQSGSNTVQVRTGVSGALGPGTGPLDTFSKFEALFGGVPVDVSTESIALVGEASTSMGTRRGVWASSGAGSSAMAMSDTDGALGPQLGAGVQFIWFRQVALLQNGEVVVEAIINPPSANEGLWNLALDRPPIPVFRTGGIVDVDPGIGFSPRIVQSASSQAPSFGGRGGGWPAHVADEGFAIYPVFFAGSPAASGLVRIQLRVSILTDGFE